VLIGGGSVVDGTGCHWMSRVLPLLLPLPFPLLSRSRSLLLLALLPNCPMPMGDAKAKAQKELKLGLRAERTMSAFFTSGSERQQRRRRISYFLHWSAARGPGAIRIRISEADGRVDADRLADHADTGPVQSSSRADYPLTSHLYEYLYPYPRPYNYLFIIKHKHI